MFVSSASMTLEYTLCNTLYTCSLKGNNKLQHEDLNAFLHSRTSKNINTASNAGNYKLLIQCEIFAKSLDAV